MNKGKKTLASVVLACQALSLTAGAATTVAAGSTVVVKKKDTTPVEPVLIETEFIKLESAMKLANVIPSGGTAKLEIQDGNVLVNGEVCTMRGKKLRPGDKFQFEGYKFVITEYAAP